MKIQFNGQPREIEPETPALEFLNLLGTDVQGVAVAINGEVIPANRLASKALREGDRVEIVEAVGGG